MLKVLLDMQVLQSEARAGSIGSRSRGLAEALLGRTDIEWHVLLSDAMPDTLPSALRWVRDRLGREQVHVLHGLAPVRADHGANASRARAAGILYAGFIEALAVDLVHVSSAFDGWRDDAVLDIDLRRRTACTASLHEATTIDEAATAPPPAGMAEWFEGRLRALSGVEGLLASSAYVAEATRTRSGLDASGVTVIGADADPIFRPRVIDEDAARSLTTRHGITRPFLLTVGASMPRKNIPRLLEAFARLPERLRTSHQLVVVGRTTEAQRDDLRRQAERLGLHPDAVVLPGFVPDRDLADLYASARATVMPSLDEGFCLPLLEAMRCGCPILGSNTTSIPEVIGRDDLTFDPLQVTAIADRLERITTGTDFHTGAVAHARTQQARFSWSSSAERACEAFRQAVERRTRPVASRPARSFSLPLAAGRYLLPLIPPREEVQADAFQTCPEEQEALDETLVRSGPCILIDVPEAGDRERPVGAPRWETSRSASAHPHLVATLEAADGTAAPWRLLRHNWPRTCREAPAAEDFPNFSEALAEVSEAPHPLLAVGAPLARLATLAGQNPLIEHGLLARALAENHAPARLRSRLLVDVSELAQRDARSGVQRVVRNVLWALHTKLEGFDLVVVRREGARYRYARDFTARFFGTAVTGTDALLDFQPGDTFLGLDLDLAFAPAAAAELRRQHLRGLRIVHVLHDTLPLRRPDWFGTEMHDIYLMWLRTLAEISDGIACVSRTTAEDVRQILAERRFAKDRSPIIEAFHLGAELDAGRTADAAGQNSPGPPPPLPPSNTPIFLTVGTLEPRKGHDQLLDAAEILWARGHAATFAIVGKRGWLVDALIERMTTHPEFERRLLWFDGIDDAMLGRVYATATAVILPSEGEGFGLPLIEAAHAGKPILARDLPVFREIAGAHATYFRGFSGHALAAAIEDWLTAHRKGETPGSTGIRHLTWSESARQLMNIVHSTPHRP